MSPGADPLTPLEAAIGMPLGGGPPVSFPTGPPIDATEALELATLEALSDGPCRVAFSGGRDSSLVLAAATRMARRAGLPEPIPLTFRFPAVPRSHEDAWQEKVIGHLGLQDWERVELHDELDLLGPTATELIVRMGVFWPANAHFAWSLARRAAPGTLLTGEGGDDLFSSWRWFRAARVLGGATPRKPRDVGAVTLALAPRAVRRAVEARRVESLPWLTGAGDAAYRSAMARSADVPWQWDAQLAWMRSRRDVTLSLQTLERFAADVGCRIYTPLMDLQVLGALARAGGTHGLGGRRVTLQTLFGNLLPAGVLARPGKAVFNEAFWGPKALAFAEQWTGMGADSSLVNPDALKATWLMPGGDWRSADLLHRVWLHTST